jgi:hypothetical protein
MKSPCETEIVELHRFFEDWFMGRLPDSAEAFSRFADVMADGFTMISPEGTVTGRASLLEALRAAHGAHGAAGSISIRVANIQERQHRDGLCLLTYEEWQDDGAGEKGRLSSALFRLRPGAPNDVEWLHVHETWLATESTTTS